MNSLAAARRTLVEAGLPPRSYIASGWEGHVFAIGSGSVAKVWHARRPDELVALQSYYTMVDGLRLPFATPVIEAIIEVPGGAVSIERELPGTPMSEVADDNEESMPALVVDVITSVLRTLRDHPLPDTPCHPPMVGVMLSDRAVTTGPIAMLLEVADRRVERFGDQLRRSVRDFDEVYSQTVCQLRQWSGTSRHVVHGDLYPPNIFLGEDLTVSAVIDWGFLSHVGDAHFDASIACGIYGMYGPFAPRHDEALVSACVSQLGYDRHRLLVYRALYAILTSNAYTEDGTDEHFAWCVATLNRADIRDALST